MSDKTKARTRLIIRAYWFAAAVLFSLVGLLLFTSQNPFSTGDAALALSKISNAFTVSGAVVGGVGAISLMAYLGAYDGIAFSVRAFALDNFIGGNREKPKSFYEYKRQRNAKKRSWLPNFLWVGAAALTLGIIFATASLAVGN